jgi:tetrapyrrole methylase family protein/MazG family protein
VKQDEFARLIEIMSILRGKQGCPWDQEQTHRSLRPYLLEETYEVLEKIDSGETNRLADELGDLLLQIVFHAQIGEENGTFTINDVIRGINEKLIRRHPHIFGNGAAKTPEEVKHRWEEIKLTERKQSVLSGVPVSQPALNRAFRVQEKAAGVGFEWTNIKGVWDKLAEELEELKKAAPSSLSFLRKQESSISEDKTKIEDEIGDILFSMVNLSRFLGVNPEDALRGTIEKFIHRFQYVESEMQKANLPLKQDNLSQMDHFWEQAKHLPNISPPVPEGE